MSDARLLRAFVAELVAAGVTDAVVCPGSRSTPLALALRQAAGLRVRVLLDERAAAFFALGMARTSGRPVVLLATSGTATVEFAPAVVEASLSRVPLVVLTADRPAEMRDRGAAQTIDQDHLYGRAAKWYAELPLFDGDPATEAHVRSVAGRAVATAAAGPAGPVQLNVPFREPLLPDGPLAAQLHDEVSPDADELADEGSADAPTTALAAPFTAAITGRSILDDELLDALAGLLGRTARGLIVAGPDDDPEAPAALAALARATGFPILADPLSGLRAGAHDRSLVITRADQLTRPGGWIEAHHPDLVIRTGAIPTSRPILQLLERTRPGLLVIDGDGGWREPALLPATFVHADVAATARALTARLGASVRRMTWTRDWVDAERVAVRAMDAWLGALDEPFEGQPFPALAAALPDGGILWAGSSMPVRDLDAWFPSTDRAITIRSNRGANGIDGVVSTALGSAAVAAGPVALVVGDVSFLHDLNALVAAKLHDLSATIVLVNNDGGGIFSFLAQAQPDVPAGSGLPEHYEELFGTPHGIDVGPIVGALGGEHRLVTHTDLASAVRDSVGRPGVRVLELRTERDRNVHLHRGLAAAVARAVSIGDRAR
ncbi:MAG: 2-succinyl-5-enolpyruvyl-6-hydroxy-3-cyclohexene-1-carboxylic-acid synthase [Candidatus Limnocylindrales bacterium]